jgi:hypothetical protein
MKPRKSRRAERFTPCCNKSQIENEPEALRIVTETRPVVRMAAD